jgi:ABC-type sugar transport system ATPase subunit
MMRRSLLSLNRVTKSFGAIQALEDFSLDVQVGDVIGLVGDNGAGKSTLLKVLSGAHAPTSGEIYLDGKLSALAPPSEAQQLGIETVYQDLSLIPEFTAAENFFLGREAAWGHGPSLFRLIRRRSMANTAEERLQALGIEIPELRKRPIERMSGGQRQMVAIARGAFWGSRILLLDEPTAALGVRESGEVLDLIRRLTAQGLSIVMVTHNLQHLWQVCNRVVVMRRGRKVADLRSEEIDMDTVVSYITGARSAEPSGDAQ